MADHGCAPERRGRIGFGAVGHRADDEVGELRPGLVQIRRPLVAAVRARAVHRPNRALQSDAGGLVVLTLDAVATVVAAELGEELPDPTMLGKVLDDELDRSEETVPLRFHPGREQ